MTLQLRGRVVLPAHSAGGFDHGDVHAASGRVFVAHTANGTVEVIDGETLRHERSLVGCPEGSGVLCTQGDGALVFAATRGAGKILVLDVLSGALRNEISVGPKPNGLAWDGHRKQLLVADVEDQRARLVAPESGRTLVSTLLPGRPRWCVFDAVRDRFLVNVREPACVVALAGGSGSESSRVEVSSSGPHGLDIDSASGRAFVACDAGVVVVLDLTIDREVARIPIAGEPDATWYNSTADRLYVAIGHPGTLDVIDGRSMSVVEHVLTDEGAHTTAFDGLRQRLYVFLPRPCESAVYDDTGPSD
jgi:DNA-binding beta-propeller fold protein YncE